MNKKEKKKNKRKLNFRFTMFKILLSYMYYVFLYHI